MQTPFENRFVGAALMLLFVATVYLPATTTQAQRQAKRKRPAIQKLTVALTENGYEPTNLKLLRAIPAQITFIRKVSATCATQVVIPDYDIKRDLPLNVPVLAEFTPKKSGTFTFMCGMGMLKGSLIVR